MAFATIGSGLRRPAIIVVPSGRCVVGEAVVVEIDFSQSVLEDFDDVVERAETVGVLRTAWVGIRDGNDAVVSGASQVSNKFWLVLHPI